jgi:hypothetical protein
VQKVHRNPELLNVLWERRLRQEGVEKRASRHKRKENSLSSAIGRKSPLRDLGWVTKHLERLSKEGA